MKRGLTAFLVFLSADVLSVISVLSFADTMPEAGLSPVKTLSQEEADEVVKLSGEILSSFTPDRYFYVGLGRSPTPVIAFLQNQASGIAVNLPLSELNADPDHKWQKLYADEQERFFEHLDRFLPGDDALRGRSIVVIDYVLSGDSLVGAMRYLKKYLAKRGRVVKVAALGLKGRGGQKKLHVDLAANSRIIEWIDLDKFPLLEESLFRHQYRSVAQYPRYEVRENELWELPTSDELRPRSEYAEFRRQLARIFWARSTDLARAIGVGCQGAFTYSD